MKSHNSPRKSGNKRKMCDRRNDEEEEKESTFPVQSAMEEKEREEATKKAVEEQVAKRPANIGETMECKVEALKTSVKQMILGARKRTQRRGIKVTYNST